MQGLKTVGLLCAAFVCYAYAAEEPSEPAAYKFDYAVNDPTTGDQKDQQETRDGDNVVGYYRTLDSDGMLRTVHYRADPVNGFTAEVAREPVAGVAVPAPAVAKAVVAKAVVAPVPVAVKVPAPSAVVPAPAPYYFGSAKYPYNYQPYSYGYQPYPYHYSPYSYGQYPYSAPYSSQYISPIVVRK